MDPAGLIADYGLFAVPLALTIAGLGLMNQDLILLAIGWASAHGGIPFWAVVAVSYPSLLWCDQILYTLCRASRRITVVRESWLARALAPLVARGMLAVFVARFMAGTRASVYVLVGLGGMERKKFILADGLAALISVPLWVWLGRTYGPALWDAIGPYAATLLGLIVASLLIAYLVHRRLAARAPAAPQPPAG